MISILIKNHLAVNCPFQGEEVRLSFKQAEMQFEIFVHQTGLFSSGLEVMVSRDWMNYNTIALINAKQLTQIANNSLCSDQTMFDRCKEKYLLGVVNDTIGCTPRYNFSVPLNMNNSWQKENGLTSSFYLKCIAAFVHDSNLSFNMY